MIRTVVTPSKKQVSLPIPDAYIGKKIEVLFYALDEVTNQDSNLSPAFPGNPLSYDEFKSWIAACEKTPTVSLKEAKAKWAKKKKKLLEFSN
jgi:hypothetical protein